MDEKHKNEIEQLIGKIQSLAKGGNYKEAAALCERMCSESTADARVWHMLGAIHLQNNNVVQAELCARQALAIEPALSGAHYNLSIILQRQGKLEEAEQCLQRALRIRPSEATYYKELGNVYKMAGKDNSAVVSYRKAIKLAPGFRDAHYDLGNTFLDMRDLHSALGCMRAAYSCDGSFVKAKAVEAKILEMQGDIEGAWQCLEPWLNQGTVGPEFADAFAAVSMHLGKEQQAIDFLTGVIQKDGVPRVNLSVLYFRLGSLQERLQQYDEAFRSYTMGNMLSEVPDSSEKIIRSMHEARRIFNKNVLVPAPQSKFNGKALVFIIGMPRSGTSLIEQILSTHSQVVAGGELGYLEPLAQEVITELTLSDDEIGGLDLQTVEHYARRHINTIKANIGSAKRITDKTTHNFRYLGLIKLLFPEAHIIHCKRSPLDTCISCFSNNFEGNNLSYSNDLTSLGAVYREYELLMDYWKEDLSIPVLEVPYEAVVDNVELWARRIVEYCGLGWEKQCLDFYKGKRQVFTASYNQVRQPIYRGSVSRWTHYDAQLEPLRQMLGESAIQAHQ